MFLLAVIAASAPAKSAGDDKPLADNESLGDEYIRVRAINAVLKARLSLSKEPEPYLILDLPQREVRLELQGVPLTRVPVAKVALNRLAAEISRDTTRITFCEVPFVLEQDHWYEDVPTLAAKDSAAVMSRPDTTGTRAALVRHAPVLALLRFERNLTIALRGEIPPTGFGARARRWIHEKWASMKSKTPEGNLRRLRHDAVLIELDTDPAMVRSLAPNLTAGTKLVLRF